VTAVVEELRSILVSKAEIVAVLAVAQLTALFLKDRSEKQPVCFYLVVFLGKIQILLDNHEK